jgi:hypothetical protein
MALPGGRKIVVDNHNYEWICKIDKRAAPYQYVEVDDDGDEYPLLDKVITIRADYTGGKVMQLRTDRTIVAPEFIAELIKGFVLAGKL